LSAFLDSSSRPEIELNQEAIFNWSGVFMRKVPSQSPAKVIVDPPIWPGPQHDDWMSWGAIQKCYPEWAGTVKDQVQYMAELRAKGVMKIELLDRDPLDKLPAPADLTWPVLVLKIDERGLANMTQLMTIEPFKFGSSSRLLLRFNNQLTDKK
jgi:hypothetical protein